MRNAAELFASSTNASCGLHVNFSTPCVIRVLQTFPKGGSEQRSRALSIILRWSVRSGVFRPRQESRSASNAFGDEAPYKTTIYNWCAKFKRDRVDLGNEFRDDLASTAVNNKNIDASVMLWPSDQRLTVKSGRMDPNLDHGSIHQQAHVKPLAPDVVTTSKITPIGLRPHWTNVEWA
ncbi:hypothetical protein EVAR_36344_1 [Eumeta japonica]|uniref:Mos1 transposase HTH domain-containing protein n=1 Tax=Eumeta variegata TaxID=151549 RepID=A0A4C1W892_EUMVA|nr:hypothetical protein EVAR_36344_1 [Eumeta japonica]